ncbi:MAG: PhoPQ-activated protein PqaA family protein, partial [Bacillota bacterium]
MQNSLKKYFKKVSMIIIVSFLLTGVIYPEQIQAQLSSYVEKVDPVYDWEIKDKIETEESSTLYLIKLTSQKWQDYTFEHRLVLIVPEKVEIPDFTGLYVGGGSLADKESISFDPEAEEIQILARVAREVHTPMAILFDVPYQPLFENLTEDALISYTFDKFLETEDPEWPLLLPMTATVVRAMDTLEEIGAQFYGLKEMDFLVFGGSKRGWTTWLTAAVDSR